MLLITGGQSKSQQLEPLNYSASDLGQFSAIKPSVAVKSAELLDNYVQLDSEESIKEIKRRLDSMALDSNDVLILYVSAHGFIRDGKPFLCCSNFAPGSLGIGQIPIDLFLDLVCDTNAKTKLVILESGQHWPDARLGMVTNLLTSALKKQVNGRDNLWVMGACQDFERSLFSMRNQHTSFGYFVAQGLQGSADLNSDQAVSLQELYRYVYTNVREFSELKPRVPLQSPFLFAGNEAQSSSNPVLLSVSPFLPKNGNTPPPPVESAPASSEKTAAVTAEPEPTPASPPIPSPSDKEDDATQETAGDPAEATAQATTENLLAVKIPDSGKSQKKRSEIWAQTYPVLGKLQRQAWDLYLYLEKFQVPFYRPIDYAPVAWRELGDLIMLYDRQIRQGIQAADTRDRLTEIIASLEALKNGEPVPTTAAYGVIDRIIASQPPALFQTSEIYSMGYWQQLEASGLVLGNKQFTKKISEFDLALKAETSKPLNAWLAKHQDLSDFYECWLAKKLIATPNLEWTIQQLALSVTRLAEQTGRPYVSQFPWIRERLATADQIRFRSLAMLEDQIERRWHQRAKASLEEAGKIYNQANQSIATVDQAYHLRNDLVKRLVYFKRLGFVNAPKMNNIFYENLNQLVDSVLTLEEQLKKPSETDWSSIQSSVKNSAAAYQRVCNLFFPNSTETNSSFAEGLVDFDTLLDIPIFEPDVRSSLLLFLGNQRALSEATSSNTVASTDPIAYKNKIEQEASFKLQYYLEKNVLSLAREHKDPKSQSEGPYEDFEKAIEQDVFDHSKINSLLAVIYQDIYQRVEEVLTSETTTQTDSENVPNRIQNAWLNYHLVDHRDLAPPPSSINSTALYQIAGFDSLDLARDRMSLAIQNQTSQDRRFISKIRNAYLLKMKQFGDIAQRQFDGMDLIKFNGASQASLIGGRSQEIEISYQFTAAEPANVSLFIDYNLDSISVKEIGVESAFNMVELRKSSIALFSPLDLVDHDLKDGTNDRDSTSALKVNSGEQNQIKLLLSPLPNALDSKLIITAVVNGQAIRHVINVALLAQSDWQLVLEPRQAEISYTTGNAIDLLPLPNRKADFEFFLQNKSNRSSNVKLALIAPQEKLTASIPFGEMSATKLQSLFDSLGPLKKIHETPTWTAPISDAPLPVPMLPPKDEKEIKPKPEDKKSPPEKIEVRHGILAVLTDIDTQISQIWRLDFLPQKPMRFLNLSAGYNSILERVEIQVKSNDSELTPSNGHEIICEFKRPLPLRSQSRLQGKITPLAAEINLFAEVTPTAGRYETVYVHVDNYPRAFIFHIPCWDEVQQIAPSLNEMNMEISKPLPSTSFKAPADSIPVEFKVDAPVAAFDKPNSLVEIGIDANRDRELNRDKTVKFYSDRQAEIWFLGLDEDGKILIENQVGDFRINLNGTGFRNSRVNVLGRIQTETLTKWSNPVEIRLDAKPPEIKRILLDPGNVVTPESKFLVRILADDGEMSGIASVKIGFADSNGVLSKDLPLIETEKQNDLSWLGEIPVGKLPMGANELLISATDGVGNQSKPSSRFFTLVTAKKMAQDKLLQRFELRGKVYYQNSLMPGAIVELIHEGGETRSVPCDATGSFRFKDLPGGNYALKAKAVVRNKPRIFKVQIVLGADQKISQSLSIDLD